MSKTIMIQGTMSNVGKSLITAALCRIFTQDGYRCAPFKSQNMALNSYITPDGLEIGRAQAMQAEAAKIEADVCMNPILLKPTNDIGSQVILMGKSIGNMRASEYFKRKKEFIPYILDAYKRLSENNDIIVIEGAGSPAEINLKQNDIVNMGLAEMLSSPVILTGDIDRGGVFAQLLGTMELLEEKERALVKGVLINKFRGDMEILRPGLTSIEKRCSTRVLGVIPYINCDIDDEDSLSERFHKTDINGLIDIAVIRLKRISNFTDFIPFECIDGVSVRYVSKASEIGNPDMIIIPGTKNTVGDLMQLRENGIEAAVKKFASKGGAVFGICGGYQMLGEKITDMEGAETKGEFRGMELIPVETVFDSEKTTTRTEGHLNRIDGIFKNLSGIHFKGYEIHMGEDGRDEHILKGKNNVYGTYIHGIFDEKQIAENIIRSLMEMKGLVYDNIKAVDMAEYKNTQYDILAENVRRNIDMEAVYDILEKGV